uniref:Retrovirus-related Pol polyprotein from transposon TNT 1-94 n=1 Tax=Tanacetum cinerariifolium TaxID=118510 RepID=A0A6L2L2I0_TANCI|nr:retrovirus-related Pol polyprotein from transposon TNT 1-94 [Tanacetum cinerariifolium]
MSYLTDYKKIDGGYVAFGGNPKGGKISDKEAVNTTCYVQNRVLVVKPHNKTPYELFHGRMSSVSFMKPFGCPVTILDTLDHLGKFDGTKAFDNAGQARKEKEPVKDYILLPLWTADLSFYQDSKSFEDDGFQPLNDSGKKVDEDPCKVSECRDQEQDDNVNSTNNVNAASTNGVNAVSENISNELPFYPNMHALEDISTFNFLSYHEDDDEEADMNNMDTTIQVSPVPTVRIHKDHPLDQVIRDMHSTTQTRNML